jgi:mersacidin/lichenicidin family type 2 lantibiotic
MALSKETVLHAWKDEEFRNSLSQEERDQLPDRPTADDGSDLSDDQLEAAAGGTTSLCAATIAAGLGYGVSEIVD